MLPVIPTTTYDLLLSRISTSDIESICSQQPGTYFQAAWPGMWVAATVYAAGDVRRPPEDNDMIYECTVGGTSGSSEPAWSTTQDGTFTDGTVTWKAHNNYSLVVSGLDSGDKVIANSDASGRQLTIAQKIGAVSHRAGTVAYLALLNSADQTIEYITETETTVVADNDILAGRTIIMNSITIISEPEAA